MSRKRYLINSWLKGHEEILKVLGYVAAFLVIAFLFGAVITIADNLQKLQNKEFTNKITVVKSDATPKPTGEIDVNAFVAGPPVDVYIKLDQRVIHFKKYAVKVSDCVYEVVVNMETGVASLFPVSDGCISRQAGHELVKKDSVALVRAPIY